jgi:hypothetical protein
LTRVFSRIGEANKKNLKLLFFSPDCRGKPGAKKIAFLVEKKRLKEALFATLEMHFFCEDL